MKKVLIALLGLCLAASLTGCLPMILADAVKGSSSEAQSEAQTAVSEASSETPAVESSSGNVQDGKGTLGDFTVDIKDCQQVEDYKGDPTIIVTYGFTNNSDKAESFMTALQAKVFQEGVECESAIVDSKYEYDSESFMKEIKPGVSFDVQYAYSITEGKQIDVEVSEFLSLNDDMVTTSFVQE